MSFDSQNLLRIDSWPHDLVSIALLLLLLLLFKNHLSSVLKFPASQPHVNMESDTALQLGSL